MQLSIRTRGVRRSIGRAPEPLRFFGSVIRWLTGVRRLSVRVGPPDAPPRVELVIVRRDAVTAYRLRGRAVGLARSASSMIAARLFAPIPGAPRFSPTQEVPS